MRLYRLIFAVLVPVLLLRALWRGEVWADLAERLGLGPALGPGPVLWLHGASVGEVTSARWVIERLLQARPDLGLLITTNTVTARQMVRGWGLARVTASLAPLDTAGACGRVLRRWHPVALVSLEAELWPTRIVTVAADRPVLMLGARMSPRSFAGWRKRAGLARAALSRVSFASAQDVLSRRHLATLGVPETAFGPDFDLKAQAVASLPAPTQRPRTERAGWLLAASTHDGEEAVLLDAFAASPFAHLIIAPRHPDRAPAIAALVTARGLTLAQRSKGEDPGGTRVYLADTLGEMDLWYARCGACVIGGTLADKGGHTPWEPARHACAILHGPSLWNFTAAFAALTEAGAALAVTNGSLAPALATLDGPRQDHLASRASRVLQASGDPNALVTAILAKSGL